MPTTSSTTSAGRGSGRWPAGAAPRATGPGSGRPIPSSCAAMSPMAAFGNTSCRPNSAISNTPTGAISKPRRRWALSTAPSRSCCSFMSSPCTYFDPLPFWYMPFEEARIDRTAFPLHAISQRPMPMYHSWHSQNAWLRQILGYNRLFINRATGRALGLDEEDWVWVSSHNGRIRVPTRLMDGVNPDTVWTWNAIGKRAGAWQLDPQAPEARRGFLLNHLISELLPATGGDGFANADPVTGQAAWYDLRVRIERAAAREPHTTVPEFAPPAGLRAPPRPAILRYGVKANRGERR